MNGGGRTCSAGRRSAVVAVGLVFFTSGATYLATPLLAIHLHRHGIPASAVGAGFGLTLLIGRTATVVTGLLTDRWGAKRLVVAGITASGLAHLSLAKAASTLSALAGMALLGAAVALFGPSSKCLAAVGADPARRSQVFAWRNLAANAGVAGGAATGGLLAGVLGAYRTMVLAGCVELAVALAVAVALRSDHRGAAGGGSPGAPVWAPLLEALRDRRMRRLILAASGFWALYAQLSVSAPLVSGATAGTSAMFLANAGVIIALQLPATRWLDRYEVGLDTRVTAGLMVAAASVLVLCAPEAAAILLPVLGAGIAVGEILVSPSLDALAVDMAADGSVGTYLGVSSLGLGIGGATGSLVGGGLVDVAGRLGLAWLPGTALASAGGLFALALTRRRPATPSATRRSGPSTVRRG